MEIMQSAFMNTWQCLISVFSGHWNQSLKFLRLKERTNWASTLKGPPQYLVPLVMTPARPSHLCLSRNLMAFSLPVKRCPRMDHLLVVLLRKGGQIGHPSIRFQLLSQPKKARSSQKKLRHLLKMRKFLI
uniref:Uncharacterized protein n=1 Tax=Rhizophora mucronata TaxID=61149 RepID=A0A2P2IW97_RHIMU